MYIIDCIFRNNGCKINNLNSALNSFSLKIEVFFRVTSIKCIFLLTKIRMNDKTVVEKQTYSIGSITAFSMDDAVDSCLGNRIFSNNLPLYFLWFISYFQSIPFCDRRFVYLPQYRRGYRLSYLRPFPQETALEESFIT